MEGDDAAGEDIDGSNACCHRRGVAFVGEFAVPYPCYGIRWDRRRDSRSMESLLKDPGRINGLNMGVFREVHEWGVSITSISPWTRTVSRSSSALSVRPITPSHASQLLF